MILTALGYSFWLQFTLHLVLPVVSGQVSRYRHISQGTAIKYRTYGRTDLSVSEVSLGGAYLMGPTPERSLDNAVAVLLHAADLGINYVDTAPNYGDSEKLLGQAFTKVKHTFHIATKVGFDPEDFDYRRDSVLWSLERSCQRLGQDRLTVAQIHEVNTAGWHRIMEPGGTLAGLRAAQVAGLCSYIGITGRAIPLLAKLAATDEFDTVLVYHDYHPCSQIATEEVLPTAASRNMGIVAASVLAGRLFTEGESHEEALAALNTEKQDQIMPVITALRKQEGTLPQQAFRYVLDDYRISTVCSGAANPEQLREVAAASDLTPDNLVNWQPDIPQPKPSTD